MKAYQVVENGKPLEKREIEKPVSLVGTAMGYLTNQKTRKNIEKSLTRLSIFTRVTYQTLQRGLFGITQLQCSPGGLSHIEGR